MFAIVNIDHSLEYKKKVIKADGSINYIFAFLGKGKRYKTFPNAIAVADEMIQNGCFVRVMEV